MFGFGTALCVLCDHQVPRSQARRVSGRKDVAVVDGCRAKWQQAGARCARCKAEVLADSDLGIFLNRYALGHLARGAIELVGTEKHV